MALELAWGRLRRAWLRRFRGGYTQRMRACRQGTTGNYPHDILDPRDLKYFRNQGDWHWRGEDDPFAWRDHLPFARVGLGEILILGGICVILAGTCLILAGMGLGWAWPLAVVAVVPGLFVLWFFRDPRRRIPAEPGTVVSPADGRIVSVQERPHDEGLGGPVVVIDIFLSVLNVHINRVPLACRVLGVTYRPGKFLNALRAEAARENESFELRLEATEAPYHRLRVRQITGAIARRIVCWAKPGDILPKGAQFGMIKLGSRTELVLPNAHGLEILVRRGQQVRAGTTVVARFGPVPGTREGDRGQATEEL